MSQYKKYFSIRTQRKLIKNLTLTIAFVGPLMTLPQVVHIFQNQNASGVSSMTWLFYVISSLIWLLYGLINRSRAIQVNSLLGAILSFVVFVGTIIY